MAFNSNTYRMNKYRKLAWRELAIARAARVSTYDWERARVPFLVNTARFYMRMHLSCRAICDLSKK